MAGMLLPFWCNLLIIALICMARASDISKVLSEYALEEPEVQFKLVNSRFDLSFCAGIVLTIWYVIVILLGYSGWLEIERKFSLGRELPEEELLELEPVTIIRPCKGVDTEMKACLESCVKQEYPKDRFEVIFCVESNTDQSIDIIKQIIAEHPDHQLSLLIGDLDYFGPNPKINNLSKGYRMAKYDIIWVLDSNVWCSPGTLARSVMSLEKSLDNGRRTSRPVVLTHHIPLGTSIDNQSYSGLLDEMFLFSSHAKFYVAFNYVSIAPCVNGKSNLYRRSHLEKAVQMIGDGTRHSSMFANNKIKRLAQTTMSKGPDPLCIPNRVCKITFDDKEGQLKEEDIEGADQGKYHAIEFFSIYIGEDNMIGTALWDMLRGRTGMTGDVVIQPLKFNLAEDTWHSYIARRIRWLRVRKYMVLAATLLEPTTESIIIGLMGSMGLKNLFHLKLSTVLKVFACHMTLWCISDWIQYQTLSKNTITDNAIKQDDRFSYPHFTPGLHPRAFPEWIGIWILRELLALPIWVKAMCGSVIQWRNRPFRIKSDLTAEEL